MAFGWLTVAGKVPVAHAATYGAAWTPEYGAGYHWSSPTVANIDGTTEVIVGDYGGTLRAFRSDGSIVWSANLGVPIEGAAAVGDINGDGQPEIVVGVGANAAGLDAGHGGGVFALDHNGHVLWHFMSPTQASVFSSVALGDIDGDGRPDVVFGTLDHLIYALHGDGSVIPGFPFDNTDSVQSSPALYDVNGDGRLDIVIGGDATASASVGSFNGGRVRVLSWGGNHVNLLRDWHFSDIVRSNIAIGDLNGDGRVEAVFATGGYPPYDATSPDARHVYAVHLDDGSVAAGWPQTTTTTVEASVGIGDLDGDGKPEVVIGDTGGAVYAYHGNGGLMWRVQPGAAGAGYYGGVAIGDMDGNGTQDVAIGYGFGGAFILNGANGATIAHPNALTPDTRGASYASQGTPAIANFGGARQLIVAGWDPSVPNFGSGALVAYSLPSTNAADAWPMLGHTPDHVAAPPSGGNPLPPGLCSRPTNPTYTPSAASGRGYWFLGLDGGVFSFGVPFYGSLPGVGVHEASQALADTPNGGGYWIVSELGNVFAFGNAPFLGSMAGAPLNAPIIRLVPTPSGRGYWLLASDGGVFSFGDARFYGSTGGIRLSAPVIGMAATRSGHGYWLVASDGGVFSYGDASFHGSTGGLALSAPIVSVAVPPSGQGYWLLGADGGVFSFGVPYFGSIPGAGLCNVMAPGVQMRSTATGNGYWVVAQDGGVFSFGDAEFHGSFPGLSGANHAVDLAVAF